MELIKNFKIFKKTIPFKIKLCIIVLVMMMGVCSLAIAAPMKIGVLAPEGTGWANSIKAMAKEIKEKTQGEVELKIYFGGSQGDEQDVLRKIRIGQLQGGIFTGKTLGDIQGDIRVLEVPFTFNNNFKKASDTLKKLAPYFQDLLGKSQFHTLSMFEIGHVYLISQKKIDSLDALKGVKIWSWEGDPIVMAMIDAMKFVSVPLALPDVLASLTTGIVEAAYAPPLGILALQWNSKVKYIIDFPITFSVGAFVVSTKSWSQVKPEMQKIVMEVSRKYETIINDTNTKDNSDSLMAIKNQKIEFIKFPESDIKHAQSYRKEIMKKLTGSLFSVGAVQKLEAAMK